MKPIPVVCLLACAACGVEQTRPSPLPRHTITQDSAGIAIVTNVAPPLHLWADAAPAFDIGGRRSAEPYQLFHVSDARRLADGSVLVANSGTQQVRLYDPHGRYVRTIGMSGAAPGQFRIPLRLTPLGSDSFAVWDPQLRRLDVFDVTGRLLRYVEPDQAATNPDLVTVFEDGSFVMRDERLVLPRSGFEQQRVTLVRYAADGSLLDSLADLAGGLIGRLGGSGMVGPPLFARRTAIAGTADGSRLLVGAGDTYEVAMLSADARLLGLVRWWGPPLTIDPADIDAHWAGRLASAPDADRRLAVQHVRNATPIAERMPAYQRILTGAEGTFWVQEFPRPSERGPVRWWSFDRAGRIAATVDLPRDFFPTDAGLDWVLGLVREDDGDHVRMYRLVAVRGD